MTLEAAEMPSGRGGGHGRRLHAAEPVGLQPQRWSEGSLEGSRLAEDEALATGESYFCSVLQDKDVAHQVDDACVLDMFEIDDAIAPGTEKLGRVKSLFAIAKRTTDEHGGTDPIDAAVISLRFQSQEVGHSKNTTLDVVGENDEVVISKRHVASELVNNRARFGDGTIGLFDRADATGVFFGKLWLVGGADWFSSGFRLHGV